MTKRQKEQHKRRSKGMKLAWERRREREALHKKLEYAKAAELAAKYHSPVMGEEVPEPKEELPIWKQDSVEEQLRKANLEIQMLQNKVERFRAYKRVNHETWSSIASLISIIQASEGFTREHD